MKSYQTFRIADKPKVLLSGLSHLYDHGKYKKIYVYKVN